MDETNVPKPIQLTEPGDTLVDIDTSTFSVRNDSILINRFNIGGDSIRAAIGVLIDYLEARDSSIIKFTGQVTGIINCGLNSKSDRYDSILA